MTRFPRLFLVALAVLAVGLACLPAEAGQPGGRAGGRAGGFAGMGMGGFGGGLNLVTVASMPQVQEVCEFTDGENEAIAEIAKGARGAGRGARLGPDATAEDRAAARAERAKAQAATDEKVKAAVGAKAKKLVLIWVGLALRDGPGPLAGEPIAKALGISEETRAKVAVIVEASGKEMMAALEPLRGGERGAITEKIAELRKATNAKIGAALSPEDKEKVNAAVAAAKDIKIEARGRGGRRGAPPATTQ